MGWHSAIEPNKAALSGRGVVKTPMPSNAERNSDDSATARPIRHASSASTTSHRDREPQWLPYGLEPSLAGGASFPGIGVVVRWVRPPQAAMPTMLALARINNHVPRSVGALGAGCRVVSRISPFHQRPWWLVI